MPYTQLHNTLSFINTQTELNNINITYPEHRKSAIDLINKTIQLINTLEPDEITFPDLITEIHNNYPHLITLLAYHATDNLPIFHS